MSVLSKKYKCQLCSFESIYGNTDFTDLTSLHPIILTFLSKGGERLFINVFQKHGPK